jgi:hypothetical protein
MVHRSFKIFLVFKICTLIAELKITKLSFLSYYLFCLKKTVRVLPNLKAVADYETGSTRIFRLSDPQRLWKPRRAL